MLAVVNGAEDVRADVRSVAQWDLDVGHLDDAADVAPKLVACGGTIAKRSGRVRCEDSRRSIDLLQQTGDHRIAGKRDRLIAGKGHHGRGAGTICTCGGVINFRSSVVAWLKLMTIGSMSSCTFGATVTPFSMLPS